MGFVADKEPATTGRFIPDTEGEEDKRGWLGRQLGLAQPNVNPQTLQAIEGITNRGWGTGLPNAAYDVGGKVTDLASKVMPPEPAAALGYGANVGVQAIPALFSGQVAKELGSPLMQSMGRGLMRSAVKPTLQDLRSGDAAKGIETMLKQGYNPTAGGVRAMQGKIDALASQISKEIAESPAVINKYDVAKRLSETLQRFRQQVNPGADTKAVAQAWDEFLESIQKIDIPVQLAQKLKTGTYRALGDKPYGELQGAATEAQKQLARGLKEEISAAVPNVAKLNTAEAELINARNLAERRALMSGNRNPLGLAPLAGGPTGVMAFLADKSDLFKSLLARMLYSGSEVIPRTVGTAAGAGVGSRMGQPTEDPQELARLLRAKLGE